MKFLGKILNLVRRLFQRNRHQPVASPQKEDARSNKLAYYQTLIDRGGGMICLPEHLGVMIGPDISACPGGWGFIETAVATPESVMQLVEHVNLGRSSWPKKTIPGQQAKKRRSDDEILDEVFESQDYIGS